MEVLPEYRDRGIGSELVRRMLAKLEAIPNLDLTCDPELQGYYQRFGMQAVVGMIIKSIAHPTDRVQDGLNTL